jgi:hypothetical protein
MWLRTLYASLPVTAVCIVHGGIHDLHPIPLGAQVRPDTTVNAIWRVLQECGFHAVLTFDPLDGLSIRRLAEGVTEDAIRRALSDRTKSQLVDNLLQTPAERALRATDDPSAAEVSFMGMDAIAEAVAQCGEPAMALVIDYASQMRPAAGENDPGLRQLMLASLMLANAHATLDGQPIRFPWRNRGGLLRHPVVWLVDRPDDLPPWLTRGDGIRQIPISSPDVDTRLRIAELLVAGQVAPGTAGGVAQRFADATEGFSTRGMFEAVQLAAGTGTVGSDIEGAVRTYREGLSENPWQSARLRELLADGEAVLRRRVTGQDEAVGQVLDILKRSALGLTGAHQKRTSTAPRGVLFFTGPTGVGKTEMAKAIAEVVFADERALLRFDMSEFRDEHAKMRLVGAPPSYVGFDAGGELTNAIRRRPHSIVLFDEIEKAGREVNDLFLQILSDGRLTDGAGQTVLFNEALIVFTSNEGADTPGIAEADVIDPAQKWAYKRVFLDAIERYFARPASENGLGRPELLGRLGDNIVVFLPIQGATAVKLANQFIDNILSNVRNRVGNTITIADSARQQLIAVSTEPKDLAMGGRGITTALEKYLVNPLSRLLFALDAGSAVSIVGVRAGAHGQVTLELGSQ